MTPVKYRLSPPEENNLNAYGMSVYTHYNLSHYVTQKPATARYKVPQSPQSKRITYYV